MNSSTKSYWAGLAGAVVLGATLILAVATKTLHPVGFAELIVHEGLSAEPYSFFMAVVALGIEMYLGVSLLLGDRHRGLLASLVALVGGFLFFTGRTYLGFLSGKAAPASCGCFGYLIERTPAEAFWSDTALLLLPLLGLLWDARVRGISHGTAAKRSLAGILSCGVMALAYWAPSLPVDDFATRLRPGVALQDVCAGQSPRLCFDSLAPELRSGRHWVVLADLASGLAAQTPTLNQAVQRHHGTQDLWVITHETDEALDELRWTAGPAYHLMGDVPASLLAPMYRTLPRSFLVVDGVVVKTTSSWPDRLEGP